MMTSSNGNIFRATGHLCGEFTGEFPTQRPVARSFDVFFDLRLNKRLRKQSRGWWFETLSRPLWRHCNASKCFFLCGVDSIVNTGSTLYSEGSFFRRFFSPKPFEMAMVRRTYGPKVLYSEVPLLRKLLCSELPYSENRPSPIRVLYYEGPLVRSHPSSKIAMFRRFYLPNFARSLRILCYEGSSWWYLNFSGHKILQY